MGTATIIALVEGVLQGVPSIIAAYQTYKAAIASGTDPAPSLLSLNESLVEHWYAQAQGTAYQGTAAPAAAVSVSASA